MTREEMIQEIASTLDELSRDDLYIILLILNE